MTSDYTNGEYTDIVRVYALADDVCTRAASLYAEMFPNRKVPTPKTFRAVTQRLREYGQFTTPNHARYASSNSTPAKLQEKILDYFNEDPRRSLRDAARKFSIGHTTVGHILHSEDHHPYHYERVRAGKELDKESRVQFCEWLLDHSQDNILFTDESVFTKLGFFNIHNEHWWGQNNPHLGKKFSLAQRFSVTVWAGIVGNCILGPYFIDGKLDASGYIQILKRVVHEMLDDVPLGLHTELYYQHNGSPTHSAKIVQDYLNRRFPDHWIGKGGTVNWPLRSPDLSPVDFYLWDKVRDLVYAKDFSTVQELKQCIKDAFENVKENMAESQWLKNCLESRARACLAKGGGRFKV